MCSVLEPNAHPDQLPLHSKFILVDDTCTETACFGSYRFNERSRWYNNEVSVASREPAIVRALSERFAAIEAEALRLASR
jgi:phosphatidylserine/phosphatidylglycerophosphate/cardiolipin synthase-like enzyme